MGPVSVSLALLSVILWGGTAVANQFAIDVYPPLFVGAVRFGLAAIFMVGWCFFAKNPIRLHGREWGIAFVVGFLMYLQIATFNYGTAISNASHATVLVNSYVFWVAGMESLILRSLRLRWWQAAGLVMAGAGVVILVATAGQGEIQQRDQVTFLGDLVLAISGLTLAIKILVVKWATKHVEPGPLILWHDVVGTAFLFLTSHFTEKHSGVPLTIEAAIALLFGGFVISGLCFVLNAQLLQKHGASQVSVFSFVTPVCGIILAYFFRGDHLSHWLVASGLLVAAGIYLVNKTTSRFTRSRQMA